MFQREAYHQSVDEGVHESKHPDRGRHVTNTRPHAHHSSGVVVGLKSRAGLALGENDKGIQDLVELAEVEDPAVVGKALVPETAHLIPRRHSIYDGTVTNSAHPLARSIIIVGRVTQPRSPEGPAEAIGCASNTGLSEGAHNAPPHDTNHGIECPGRVDGKEDVVKDDKGEEGAGLADRPGLLAAGEVEAGEGLDSDGVDSGNGQGHLGVESGGEEVVGDVEGVHDGDGVGMRRRESGRVSGGRPVEEALVGHGAHHEETLRHGDGCCSCLALSLKRLSKLFPYILSENEVEMESVIVSGLARCC